MGAYCANCRTWMHRPGDETCSAACRNALKLRRAGERQRAMKPSELAQALGDRLKPMSVEQLRNAEAAMQAEPFAAGSMFSEFDRDFYFGTDIMLPLREVQGNPLPIEYRDTPSVTTIGHRLSFWRRLRAWIDERWPL